jgi:hypothetical protein
MDNFKYFHSPHDCNHRLLNTGPYFIHICKYDRLFLRINHDILNPNSLLIIDIKPKAKHRYHTISVAFLRGLQSASELYLYRECHWSANLSANSCG